MGLLFKVLLHICRWARKMEDEDLAPNTYSWSSRYHGKKVVPVPNIPVFCTDTTFCAKQLEQLNVFGAISSASIWRAPLYTTPSSMKSGPVFIFLDTFCRSLSRCLLWTGQTALYWTVGGGGVCLCTCPLAQEKWRNFALFRFVCTKTWTGQVGAHCWK